MHSIDVDRTAEFVTVHFSGLVAVAERGRALEEVVVVLADTGYQRVLVDFWDADFAVDDFASSNAFASRLAFDETLRRCRIAYLIKPGARANPIVEALADARGFSCRRFDGRRRVMHWLLHGIDHQQPASVPTVSTPKSRWAGLHPSDDARTLSKVIMNDGIDAVAPAACSDAPIAIPRPGRPTTNSRHPGERRDPAFRLR